MKVLGQFQVTAAEDLAIILPTGERISSEWPLLKTHSAIADTQIRAGMLKTLQPQEQSFEETEEIGGEGIHRSQEKQSDPVSINSKW